MNLIIDGSSLLHRCYWINQKQQLDNGEVFIFLRSIKTYIKQFKCTECYVCWDKKLLWPSTNFRKQMPDAEYKANRTDSINVYRNEDQLAKMLSCLGIRNMFPRIMEADDVIAWLCHNLKCNMIVSVDSDLLQLVSLETKFFDPKKKIVIDLSNFEEFCKVRKDIFLIYRAITGDISDNIKGWYGYGPVKAKAAAEEIVKDPSKLLTFDEKLRSIFEKNTTLIDLSVGYNLAGPEEVQAYKEQLQMPLLSSFDSFIIECEKLKFQSFLKDIDSWKKLFQ